jgi:hypothetical protein
VAQGRGRSTIRASACEGWASSYAGRTWGERGILLSQEPVGTAASCVLEGANPWRKPGPGERVTVGGAMQWWEPALGTGEGGEVETWQGIDVWGGRTLSRERMCVRGSCMSVLGLPCVLEFCAVKGAEWCWLPRPWEQGVEAAGLGHGGWTVHSVQGRWGGEPHVLLR